MHRELESLVARLLLSSDPKCKEAAEELEKVAQELSGELATKDERIADLEETIERIQENLRRAYKPRRQTGDAK